MATEKRMIDANALIKDWNELTKRMVRDADGKIPVDFGLVIRELSKTPTVDAVEVVHGVWDVIEDDYAMETIYRCSVCKEDFVTIDGTPETNLWNFCPNCGADMRERKDNGRTEK